MRVAATLTYPVWRGLPWVSHFMGGVAAGWRVELRVFVALPRGGSADDRIPPRERARHVR